MTKPIKHIEEYGNCAKRLWEKSVEATNKAYSPNSGVKVGAAALIEGRPGISPKTVIGFNFELRQYNEAVHCEESLADAALRHYDPQSRPEKWFRDQMVITSNIEGPLSPCGACRDLLTEYAKPAVKVILANLKGTAVDYTVEELLPNASYLIEHDGATELQLEDVDPVVQAAIKKEKKEQRKRNTQGLFGNDKVRTGILLIDPMEGFWGRTVSQFAYHGFQALEIAGARAMDAQHRKGDVLPVTMAILWTDEEGFVLPFGRERQWLADVNRAGGEQSMQVYCVSRDKVLVTDPDSLLPNPCYGDLESKIR